MCTHSPEILSSAFRELECTLLHLKSPNDLTPIGKRSIEEYSVALHKLGASVGESLFYEGTIFVEGESDVTFIETSFPEIARKYKIKDRGGRREIEKAVQELQALEKRGERVEPIFLIFDHDDAPSELRSSKSVRVSQWRRRCVENYMIDVDVIAELLRDPYVTTKPIESAGEVHKLCRQIAFNQVQGIAAREVYNSLGYQNASIMKDDVTGESTRGDCEGTIQ